MLWFIFFLLGGDLGYTIHAVSNIKTRIRFAELLRHGVCEGLQFSFFPLPLYCDPDGAETKA